ncbi:MAG TPA: hypothetical protein VGA67_02295 [Candidatus Dojkabacteria bacterium]|jgi:hypothetical protein
MKKQAVALFILILLIILVGGIYFFMVQKEDSTQDDQDNQTETVELSPTKARLRLLLSNGIYTLQYNRNGNVPDAIDAELISNNAEIESFSKLEDFDIELEVIISEKSLIITLGKLDSIPKVDEEGWIDMGIITFKEDSISPDLYVNHSNSKGIDLTGEFTFFEEVIIDSAN